MKKIIKLILICILFIPLNVLACPHVDVNGVSHFQFYNMDYTVMTMMYPKKHHLYSKDVPMGENGEVVVEYEDDIILESFGFPLKQDKQAYWDNYWITDVNLQTENWADLIDKTTVEGIKKVDVVGENYNLEVFLTNTFNNSLQYVDEKVWQVYYNIDTNYIKYEKTNYKKVIEQSKLSLLTNDALNIKANYMVTDSPEYNYENESINIDKFFDEINVSIKSDKVSDNPVVLNLNKDINETNYIECNYSNNNYNFVITEPGVYVVVDNKDIVEQTINLDELIEKEEKVEDTNDNKSTVLEDKEQNKFLIPSILFSITVIIVILWFIFKKKGK